MLPPFSVRWLIPFALVVVLLPACDGSDDKAADSTLARTTTATTTTPPDSSPSFSAAESLLLDALGSCPPDALGASPAETLRSGEFINEVSPGIYQFVDSDGVALLVDPDTGIVTGRDGEDGEMPYPYVWCAPDVFVGSIAEGPDDEAMAARDEAWRFFQFGLSTCDVTAFDGSADDPTVGGELFEEVSPGVYQFIDAWGSQLLVDIVAGHITGLDGPDGVLPHPYVLACPPDVFVGYIAEGGEGEAAYTGEDGDDSLVPAYETLEMALNACNEYSLEASGTAPFDGSDADPAVGGEITGEIEPGVYRFVDADGTELQIHVVRGIVTGPDGPDGVIPWPYSFRCPSTWFPGTIEEGEG